MSSSRRLLLLAWLGWVFDVADTALFTYAKRPLFTELLGAAEYKARGAAVEGAVQTVFLLGWAVGGIVFGRLADRWGRSRVLALTVLGYSLLTASTALARTVPEVTVLRGLTGLFIGGEWAAGAALVAEAFSDDPRRRAWAASGLQTAAAIGPLLAAGLAALLPGQWRALFLCGAAPAFLAFLARRSSHDRPVEFVAASPEPWDRRVLVGATVLGAAGIVGAGIFPFWLPNLVGAFFPGAPPEVIAARSFTATLCLHAGTLAGLAAFAPLATRFGRRRAFALFFGLAPVAILLIALGASSWPLLLLGLPLVSFVTLGVTAGYALYLPELFPADRRATGAGIAYSAGRVLAAPFPLLLGWLISANGVGGGLALGSLVYLVGGLALLVLPETATARL